MKRTFVCTLALAGFFIPGTTGRAQSVIVTGSLGQQTLTTGMIGFTTNQTARLTVLNLNSTTSVASTTTGTPASTPGCTVQLQFFDGQNNMLKSVVVTNFAPQTATTLDLKRTEVTTQTGLRAEIRGMVTVNPTSATAESTTAAGYCTVFPTLQIFDETTGSTITLTSDTRSIVPGRVVMPLLAR
jgi:hypothetical protein